MKTSLQLMLKVFNSVAGLTGIGMIMYGLWLIRLWQTDMKGASSEDQTSFPWYESSYEDFFCYVSCCAQVIIFVQVCTCFYWPGNQLLCHYMPRPLCCSHCLLTFPLWCILFQTKSQKLSNVSSVVGSFVYD